MFFKMLDGMLANSCYSITYIRQGLLECKHCSEGERLWFYYGDNHEGNYIILSTADVEEDYSYHNFFLKK